MKIAPRIKQKIIKIISQYHFTVIILTKFVCILYYCHGTTTACNNINLTVRVLFILEFLCSSVLKDCQRWSC
jgi:hypothetical protein